MPSFPGAIKTFATLVDFVDTYLAAHNNERGDEITAIETELGINPPDVDDTVDAVAAAATVALRLSHIANIIKSITGKAAWYTDPAHTLENLGVSAQVFLSAASGQPKTTAGCSAATPVEMTTNKQNLKVLDFDKDTEEHADFTFVLPSDYNGGTMTAKFFWMHAATTTDFGVVWGIEGRVYANDDALDQAIGTAQTIADTGGTTEDLYISDATAAITWAGTPAGGQLINLTVYRKAADGSDTLAIDARLIGVQLSYTRS